MMTRVGASSMMMTKKTSSPTAARPAKRSSALRFDGGALAFSLVVTLLAVPSTLSWYLSTRTSEIADMLWTKDPKTLAVGLVGGAVMLVVVYLVCAWLFSRVDDFVATPSTEGPLPLATTLRSHFARTLALIVCCWMPWFVAHLPGTFDDDTVWQLIIWRAPTSPTDHHPWFDTALFGFFMDLGRSLGWQGWGLIIYGALQLVITAATFSLVFCYIRRFRVPRPLLVGALVVVCAIPLYASYASEMVKDSVFSWPWLLFGVIYVELVRTRGEAYERRWLAPALFACCLLMALSRKTGIYIEVIALAALLVACSSHRVQTALVAVGVICAFAAWQFVALPLMGVEADSAHDTWSVPFQQVTRVLLLHPDDVSADEYASIDAVLEADAITDAYNPYLADPVKDSFRDDFGAHLPEFLRTWVALGLRHPITYFEAALDTDQGLYSPIYAFETKNDMSQAWVDDVKIFFARGMGPILEDQVRSQGDTRTIDQLVWDFASETTDGMATMPQVVGLEHAMNTYEKVINRTPLRLFSSTSFMGLWVPLMTLCYALRRRSRDVRRLVWCLVPSIVLLLSLAASPGTVPRYYAPAAYIAPLLLALPFIFSGRTTVRVTGKSLGSDS